MWASPCISLSSAEDEPCRAGGRAGTTRGCCGSDADRACRDAVRVTQGCRWEHAGRGGGQGELAAAACPSVLRAQIKPQRAPQPAGSNGLTSCSSLLAALCLGWAPGVGRRAAACGGLLLVWVQIREGTRERLSGEHSSRDKAWCHPHLHRT